MKKILICSTYFYPYISGLSLYPYRLAKLLTKEKHQVTVLTFQHQSSLPLFEKLQEITVKRLPPHLRLTKGLINFFYPFFAWKLVKQHELILLNCPGIENFWPALFGRLMGKKVVVLYHCDLELKQSWLLRMASALANLSSSWCCWLGHAIINSSKEYATTSPVLKPFLNKVRYFYPLTDKPKPELAYLKQLKQIYPKARPIIGFVGRFSQEKNLEVLIASLAKLKKPYPKLLFACAGPYSSQVVGETKYYQQIQNQIQEQGLNFAILGILPDSRLTAFFQFLDLLVLPSNNRTEAFGMVQLEALQQGTPVIASNSPGVAKVIKITKAGELFTPNSVSHLAKKITTVLDHKLRYRRFALHSAEKLNLALSKQKLIEYFR